MKINAPDFQTKNEYCAEFNNELPLSSRKCAKGLRAYGWTMATIWNFSDSLLLDELPVSEKSSKRVTSLIEEISRKSKPQSLHSSEQHF